MLPEPSSPTGSDTAKVSSLSPTSSRKSSVDDLPSSPENGPSMSRLGLSMEDLDLLPTKDATPTNDLSAGECSGNLLRPLAPPGA